MDRDTVPAWIIDDLDDGVEDSCSSSIPLYAPSPDYYDPVENELDDRDSPRGGTVIIIPL